MSFRGSRNFAEVRGIPLRVYYFSHFRRGNARLRGVVDPLVFFPSHDFEVVVAVDLVGMDHPFAFELAEPLWHQGRRVVVIGEELACQHPRRGPAPAMIVGEGPEENEKEPGVTRHPPQTFGLGGFGFDRSDSAHSPS